MVPANKPESWQLDRYSDYLRMLARLRIDRRLQAKLDASDIAQQALTKAHEHRDQFRGASAGELASWLRTILDNTIATTVRQYATEARDVDCERALAGIDLDSSGRSGCGLADNQSTPSQQLMRVEELVRLADALAQLPQDQRQVVELHHLRGWPVAQIATELERTKPAVMGLLFRGINKLRSLLGEAGEP